jgi:leucyl/phenylalanyl-tRNA--protein transferase
VPVEPDPSTWSFGDAASLAAFDPEEDLVAIGADLEPGTLLTAYRRGLFPMPSGTPGDPMYWFCPAHRGVLFLDGMRVTRSLRRSRRDVEIRVNTAFEEVLDACADPRRPSGWIDDDIRTAYLRLHRLGWAHSVEAWRDGRLAGGLYGVAVGGLFAGESMFHRERDASKVALLGLVELMREGDEDVWRDRIIDVQWSTPHLASLGVVEVSRIHYLQVLARAQAVQTASAFAGSGQA